MKPLSSQKNDTAFSSVHLSFFNYNSTIPEKKYDIHLEFLSLSGIYISCSKNVASMYYSQSEISCPFIHTEHLTFANGISIYIYICGYLIWYIISRKKNISFHPSPKEIVLQSIPRINNILKIKYITI